MERNFKIGDLVKLKSGGPTMTVREYKYLLNGTISDHELICEWFDKNHELKSNRFEQDSLDPVNESTLVDTPQR